MLIIAFEKGGLRSAIAPCIALLHAIPGVIPLIPPYKMLSYDSGSVEGFSLLSCSLAAGVEGESSVPVAILFCSENLLA